VSNYFVKVSKDNSFAKKQHVRFLSRWYLYEDFDMNFDVKDEILYLHDETTGSLSFTITIEDKYTGSQKEKVFIADISKSGRVGYNTTYRKENVFTAKVRSLGML
jgi:hypothetical protein